ncbi:MAG: hypothetical protein ACKVHE_05740 [Planctomycetales bacterium]
MTEFAWYIRNSGRVFHEVAGKSANALGRFDTLGNEFEWCLEEPDAGRQGSGDGGIRNAATTGRRVWEFELNQRIREWQLRYPDTGLNGAFRIVRES